MFCTLPSDLSVSLCLLNLFCTCGCTFLSSPPLVVGTFLSMSTHCSFYSSSLAPSSVLLHSVCQLHLTQCSYSFNMHIILMHRSFILCSNWHLIFLCRSQALYTLLLFINVPANSFEYHNLHNQLLPPHHTLKLTGQPQALLYFSVNFDL